MDIGAGPGLIFNTLPEMFSVMPMGRVVGSLFLVALTAVAFLSLVAAYQVPATSFQQLRLPKVKNGYVLIFLAVLQAILSLPSCLYPELIATLDLIFGSGMQVFGSALAVLGLAFGLGKKTVFLQIFSREDPGVMGKLVLGWLRWAIPLVLFSVLLGYVYTSIG